MFLTPSLCEDFPYIASQHRGRKRHIFDVALRYLGDDIFFTHHILFYLYLFNIFAVAYRLQKPDMGLVGGYAFTFY